MYELVVSKKAEKEIKKISKLHQKAVIEVLEEIRSNPISGKPLTRELTGWFSYKIGVYRIVYKINTKDKIIFILTAGHRLTIYK